MKRLLAYLTVALLFAGCARELAPAPAATEPEGETMRFSATLEQDGTKAALTGSPSDATRSMVWQPGDAISVTNGKRVARFVSIEKTDSDCAEFEGEVLEGTTYYAAYPYSSSTSFSKDNFSITLPSEQKYVKDGVDAGSLAMVGKVSDGSFNFMNLCGIFAFQLYGSAEITAINFSGYDENGDPVPVAGPATVDMSYTTAPRIAMADGAVYSLTVNCLGDDGKGVTLSAGTPTFFHVVLPPGDYASFKLRVRSKSGSMLQKGTKTLYLKRSERKTAAAFNFSPANDNLSSNGTANCYVVPGFGEFSFDASVKGNSYESVGAAASAEVLWESFGTTEAPNAGDVVSDVRLDAGDICFKANRNGNAVVAVKDAAGDILWSWHLWICEGFDPSATAQTYYNGAGIVMDRNLGALSTVHGDPLGIGLVYQWGRKDPFLSNYNFSGTDCYIASTPGFPGGESASSSKDIAYTIKHPMVSIWSESESHGDWLVPKDGVVDSTRWAAAKTLYDPCPPGWKVPKGGFAEDGGLLELARKGKDSSLSTWDDSAHGRNFGGVFGDGEIWYQTNRDDYIELWCSSMYLDNYNYYNGYIFANTYYISKYDVSIRMHELPQIEYFVRCCDERTAPELQPAEATDITADSAVCHGKILSDGGFPVEGTGVVYSTKEWIISDSYFYYDNYDYVTVQGTDTSDSFSVPLSSLEGNRTYYYRVYATNAVGPHYSEMGSFTTAMEGSGTEPIGNDPFEW